MRFNQEKFDKWEKETHIPEATLNMVNFVCEKIGCGSVEEQTIRIFNRGGHVVGYTKGFTISYCTSSLLDGPSVDYSDELIKWIKGLGFTIENSYGDNGMDSATNWQDTFWHYDFNYKPCEIWDEAFYEYSEDEEYDEYDEPDWDDYEY